MLPELKSFGIHGVSGFISAALYLSHVVKVYKQYGQFKEYDQNEQSLQTLLTPPPDTNEYVASYGEFVPNGSHIILPSVKQLVS